MYEIEGTCVSVGWLVMGPIENNVYLVDDGEGCFVVDPTCDAQRILDAVGDRSVDAIFVTHAHWDHTGALKPLRDATGAKVIASEVEAPYISGEKSFTGHTMDGKPCPVDCTVADGDVLEIGKTSVKIIATPGHTPGGICLYIAPEQGQSASPVLLSGDTLFAGAHGRVDFDEGDMGAMRESLARLACLPEDTVVFPGHNNVTTIARELPWLKRC